MTLAHNSSGKIINRVLALGGVLFLTAVFGASTSVLCQTSQNDKDKPVKEKPSKPAPEPKQKEPVQPKEPAPKEPKRIEFGPYTKDNEFWVGGRIRF